MIGGIEAYVLAIGGELVGRGYDVTVYTPDSVLGRRMPVEAEVGGVKVRRVHVSIDISYRLRFWPSLAEEIRKGHPDVVHVYSHDSYSLLALLGARSIGVPLVITTYGPLSNHSDYGFFEGGLLRAYDALISPYLLRRCDYVMIRYPEIASWLSSLKIPEKRIRLEPSGIPLDSLRQRDGSGFSHKNAGEGPIVLYIGRISPQKGLLFAVEAMRKVTPHHPDVRLIMMGPDYEGFGVQIKKKSEDLGISENVVLLPRAKDEDEQLHAIASCDAFIMPSVFEGFSQAVMKAMAQGKPVVVTNAGGLPFEVGFGSCGVICRRDPEDLGGSLNRILDDPELSKRLGSSGRERAKDFTFDRVAEMLSQTYSELLHREVRVWN
jgi:glycosyltransferase involved in cell wall biosynthesis